MQAGNATLSPAARGALRDELVALRDEVLTLANSTHGGSALFGGHAESAVVKQPDGTWSYAGDAGEVRRRVGQGTVVRVNVDGATRSASTSRPARTCSACWTGSPPA